MAAPASRFAALKQRVGGNREKLHYEDTFGATPLEKGHVTAPSASNTRILSELNFAIELSRVNEGKYDKEIESALDLLEAALEKDGVLTNGVCAEAEALLLPLAPAAKEYEVLFAAHAHIDMNWMWGWQETVAATLATFRTMLNLMKEYPEFTFMQSQGSVYRIVEKYDPDMMDEIKARIKEGRWEVTASAWVETDKNMPDAESLIHHITVTRDYLKDVWGVDPDSVKVDFSPDTFGHSRFIPEINSKFGVKYYYHCRGLGEVKTIYRYKAPSGSEILCYREPYWYNSAVTPDAGTGIIGLSERTHGLKTGLVVYGVGDHGGGATRRDVERIIEMAQWPVFPTFRFGRLHDFFEKAEALRERYDVVDRELNALLTGCYTTQSRVKLGNRRSEVSLNDASKLCALGSLVAPVKYPARNFNAAWQNVLFTHFHDILTGSCVQESREHAMGLFADALAYTQTAESNAMRVISENVDTSVFKNGDDIAFTQAEGAGVGFGIESYAGVPNPERGAGKSRAYTVFNTASQAREDVVTLTVWDYTGDLRRLEVIDRDGRQLPFELLDPTPVKYWDHLYIRVAVCVNVPALGFTTLCVRETEIDRYPTFYQDDLRADRPHNDLVLENDYIKAEFSGVSGALVSLIDKQTGAETLSAPASPVLCLSEQRTNNAWQIGRILKELPVDDTLELAPFKGALISGIRMKHKVMSSFIETEVSLTPAGRELHYDFKIDWNEASLHADLVPVLRFNVPVNGGADRMLCDVPAGCIVREAKGQDAAASSYAAALGDAAKPAIVTDCKYGYRLHRDALSVSLINSSHSPDPYPERGMHRINLWLTPSNGCAVCLKRTSERLMRPLVGIPTAAKSGSLPGEFSLMGFEAATSILSSVEKCGCGAIAVRVYEMAGKSDVVTLTMPAPVKEVSGADARIDGCRVSFAVPPCSIVTAYIK